MASNHGDRTADHSRTEFTCLTTVIGMRDESKTVKSLRLKVEDKGLSFKAGQWIDILIPGVETVGGFSMCSSPVKLQTDGCMDLAVKYSTHPPAHWIHTECKEGDQVKIRVCGDFYLDPAADSDVDLLLIAGGVGINPLYSMINEVTDLNKGYNSDRFTGRVMLLYSANTIEELIFNEKLSEIHSTDVNITCQFHVTREGNIHSNIGSTSLLGRRIDKTDLQLCFDWLRQSKTIVYICGPSRMIEDMEKALIELKVDKTRIKYENWW